MRPGTIARWGRLLAAVALVGSTLGCHTMFDPEPVSRGPVMAADPGDGRFVAVEIGVRPIVGREAQGVVPLGATDVATIRVTPYRKEGDGSYRPISSATGNATSEGASDAVSAEVRYPVGAAQTVRLTHLRANTTYRIHGDAYDPGGNLLSDHDRSFVDLDIGTDPLPGPVTLTVELRETPFSGQAFLTIATVPVIGAPAYSQILAEFQVKTPGGSFARVSTASVAGGAANRGLLLTGLAGNTDYRFIGRMLDAQGNLLNVASTDIHVADDLVSQPAALTFSFEGQVSTFATGFSYVKGLAADADGNVWYSDALTHKIGKISPAGVVAPVAGTGAGGWKDGDGASAQFKSPLGIAFEPGGDLVVADSGNAAIRRVSPDGTVSTIASGSPDLVKPAAIAVDAAGNKWIIDKGSCKLLKLTPTGTLTAFAGGTGACPGISNADGVGAAAGLTDPPTAIAIDPDGNLFLAGYGHSSGPPEVFTPHIRWVSPGAVVSTLFSSLGNPVVDGPASTAKVNLLQGVVSGGPGALYVLDWAQVRKVSYDFSGSEASASMVTVAGGPSADGGNSDGSALSQALFAQTGAITRDASGTIYFSCQGPNRIRKFVEFTPPKP